MEPNASGRETGELRFGGWAMQGITSAPLKDSVSCDVVGENHTEFKTSDTVVCRTSFDTNCLAPSNMVVDGHESVRLRYFDDIPRVCWWTSGSSS